VTVPAGYVHYESRNIGEFAQVPGLQCRFGVLSHVGSTVWIGPGCSHQAVQRGHSD
jgi:hypothetical protein